MQKYHPKLTVLLVIALLISLSSHQANAATTVVHPGNLNGWVLAQETGTTGSPTATFVNGPGTPLAGTGSLQFTLGASDDGIGAFYGNYMGMRLDSITALSYSTYVDATSTSTDQTTAFQFGMDYDLTDADTTFQGRLVYEPYQTETVTKGIWQTWTPMTGEWFATRAPFNATCPMADPCTWAEVLASYPNAGIHTTAGLGIVALKAGSGWPAGFIGSVDNFTITTGTVDDTWDFELDEPITPTPITPTPITPTPITPTPITPTPITPTPITPTPITPTPITPTPITPTPITPTLTPTCVKVAVAPLLLTPIHRTHTTDTTPTFTWSSVNGALSYRLMIYVEDRSFVYKKRTFNTSYTLLASDALTPAQYLWRVRTQDEGCSTWTRWSKRNTLFVD